MSFPTATQARSQAVGNTTVLNEIHAIESAVLQAVQASALKAPAVGGDTSMTNTADGSPLTLAQSYYNVWKGTETDDTKAANMQAVLDNFSKLGYGIKRVVNPATGTTLLWYISW